MKQLAALAFAAIVPIPDGWRAESFTFPLQFAAKIPYEGEELVRFAPGWARFADDSGFSYVFAWDVKATPVTAEDLEDHLEAYFDGLMKNVRIGRKLEVEPTKTSAALHPMTALEGWAQAYGAEVRTFNAFSKGEPLLLHGEVSQRDCGDGRMLVFFAFSKAPRAKPAWDALRDARRATTCK